jgi:RNA recognition motif-containing protein
MKLHIGNLPKSLTEAELKALVTPFAEPVSTEIVKDSAGASRGYGFVVLNDAEQGKAVQTGLDGKEVGGQTLKVGEARPRKGEAPRATA